MGERTGHQVVHSYDVASRRVLCGRPEQTSSSKHAAGVTCRTCRELLRSAQGAHPAAAPAPGRE